MRSQDPALAAIERKLDAGTPLSLEDGLALYRTPDIHTLGRLARAPEGAQERQESLLRSQPLHQLDQRLLCRLHVLLVCGR